MDIPAHATITHSSSVAWVPWYKTTKTRMRICCGKCITGPKQDLHSNICVWFCLIVPSAIFGYFIGPGLYSVSLLLPILYGMILFACIALLLCVQCGDPGIIPPEKPPKGFQCPPPPIDRGMPTLHDDYHTETQHSYTSPPPHLQHLAQSQTSQRNGAVSAPQPSDDGDLLISPPATAPTVRTNLEHEGTTQSEPILPKIPAEISCTIDGVQLKFKWCSRCNIYRPPRAAHDYYGNACFLEYDHFCPFVNNIVAARNYGFFLLFLAFVFCYIAAVLIGGVYVLTAKSIGQSAIMFWVAVGGIGAVAIGLVIAIGILGGFHIFLVCSGKTTKEKLGRGGATADPASAVQSRNNDANDNINDLQPHSDDDDIENQSPDTRLQNFLQNWVKKNMRYLTSPDGGIRTSRIILANRPKSLINLDHKVPVHVT